MKTQEGYPYIFISATELLEIADELLVNYYRPHKTDPAGWVTLEMRVREESGKDYRLDPSDWGLDDVKEEGE